MPLNIIDFIYRGVSVIISLAFHELAHGFVSHKLGDPTPKREGRLTLNPFAHMDLFGTLCLLFLGFGWAKPVQINPQYYKNKKLGTVLVSLAGPCSNFIQAFIGLLLIKILPLVGISYFLSVFVTINISLGVFNLIPIPPLDGSKILYSVLPEDLYFKYMRYEQYGMFILMALLITNVLTPILTIGVSSVYSLFNLILGFI